MSDVIRGLGIEIDLSGDADSELRDWIKGMKEARGGADSFAGSMTDLEKEMVASAKKIGMSEEHLKDLINETRRAKEVQGFANKYGFAMNDIQKKTQETSGEVSKFGTVINGVLAAGALTKIFGAGKEMVKLAADFEQTTVAFEVMLGNADKAKAVLKDLDKFSNVTPFEPRQVNEAAKTMLQFKVKAQDLIPLMQKVGDVAAGTGKDYNSLAAMVGKANALNKVDNEMLQQVPVLYGELAKTMGKTEKQIFEMASAGKIGFKELENAMASMTSKGGVFFGMMDKQSKTAIGLWSTLVGNIDNVKRSFGMMILEALKPLLEQVVKLTGWIVNNKTAMNVLKIALLVITPIIGVLFAGAIFNAVRALNVFRWATIKAMLPYVAIVAAIMAVILVVEDLYTWFKGGDSIIGPWLEKHKGAMTVLKVLAGVIGIFLVVMVVKATIAFGGMAIAVIAATWPILAIIAVIALIVAIVYDLVQAFTGGKSVIADFASSAWNSIKEFFAWVWGGITSFVSGAIDAITSFGAKIIDIITWPFRAAYEKIKNALGSVWNFLFGKDKDKKITISGSVKQVAGARAAGGPVDMGKTYLVGEKGPELFTPDRDGYVLPDVPGTTGGGKGGSGSGSGGIVISPVLNFNGPVSKEDGDYIKNIVTQAISKIAEDLEGGVRAGLGLEVG